jgi:3-phosphoshikimate 1-carboxyvinyltransferase
MNVYIEKSRPHGQIYAPPSKSMAHRNLICAALAEGKSTISNIDFSDDILATLDCIKAIGARYEIKENSVMVDGTPKISSDITLFCRECGSTIRFFIPICASGGGSFAFCGSKTLLSRPMTVYEDIFKKQDIEFINDGEKISLSGILKGGEFFVKGDISSQFISGLLFSLPLCENDSVITLIPPIESRSYILLTLSVLKNFGIKIDFKDNKLYIKGNQKYTPCDTTVEGDFSNAAFFEAFNYLGGDVSVNGLSESLQGDRVYMELFEKIKQGNAIIDISDCPDLGPVLFSVASIYGGTFTGTKRLKIKESNRGEAMAEELSKFGVKVIVEDDKITVEKTTLKKPDSPLYGHNDHRIVMALSVLLTLTGGEIQGAEAVKKSLPDFFDRLEKLNIDIKYENE